MYPLNLENQFEKYFERVFVGYANRLKIEIVQYLKKQIKSDSIRADAPTEDILRFILELKDRFGDWLDSIVLEKQVARYFSLLDAWSRDNVREAMQAMLSRLNTPQPSAVTGRPTPAGRTGELWLTTVNLLSTESGMTKTLLERVVRQNVGLIKLLASEHFDGVAQALNDGLTQGKTLKELTDAIEALTGVNRSRAKFWARDQASKFFGEVTKQRQVNAGIPGYIWRTLKDGRVRDSHASVDGQYFEWKNPPHVGIDGRAVHPGEDYNCRCWAEPAFGKEFEDTERREDPLAYMRKNTLEQELRQHEAVIGKQIDQETIQVFDTQGRVVGLRHGTGKNVNVQQSDYKRWNNCIMIHNHPYGWNFPLNDPRRAGNSFSPEDIKTACEARLRETRVITPKYRYIVKLNGRDEKFFDKAIKPLYLKYEKEIKIYFQSRINANIMSKEQAEAEHFHAIWSKVFRDLDIDYTREEI